MEINISFVIEQSTNTKFGVSIVARDVTGTRIGKPVPLIDALYSSPAEAGDALLGMFRGAAINKIGTFERDVLGIGAAIAKAS